MEQTRSLRSIAQEIDQLWKPVNYAALPYLNAMYSLTSMNDYYGMDSAYTIVLYFLSNASSWKGDDARRIKGELKSMLKYS